MLTEFNFKESLDFLQKYVKGGQFDNILLAYRLAKHSIHSRYPESKFKLNLPFSALNNLIAVKKTVDFSDITSILAYYIKQYSFLLSNTDIFNLFGVETLSNVNLMINIEKIACSNAVITKSKQKTYVDKFSYNIQLLKVVEVITGLKGLDLDIDKTYPLKVYNRYLPIFENYKNIHTIISQELKITIFKLLKKHKDMYSQLDIMKLYSIVTKGIKK